MTEIRIPFTGFEPFIDEDQPALYLSTGSGNTPGAKEVHLHLYDPVSSEGAVDRPLGWVSVARLRDALDSLDIN